MLAARGHEPQIANWSQSLHTRLCARANKQQNVRCRSSAKMAARKSCIAALAEMLCAGADSNGHPTQTAGYLCLTQSTKTD